MADVFANNATLTTTSTSGTTAPSSGTSEAWSVSALSSLWPSLASGQTMSVQDAAAPSEIIRITASTGSGATSITVTRGADSTTPVAHGTGATFICTVVASAMNQYVVYANGPSGGNDGPYLRSIISGTSSVINLVPGTTYVITDSTAWSSFSGVINGNGATLSFTYSGSFTATPPVGAWTKVTCNNLFWTSKNSEIGAIVGGASCSDIVLNGGGVFDCTPVFINPIAKNLTVQNFKMYQVSPGTDIQQTILTATGGLSLFQNCIVAFAPVGSAGGIFSAVSTTPVAGSSIRVIGCEFFCDNLSGYFIDAAIDVEPLGSVPIESVEISGNTIYNGQIYATGAKYLDIHDNRMHYTSVDTNAAAVAFILYNGNGSYPATGDVNIHDNEIFDDSYTGTFQLLDVLVPAVGVTMARNKTYLNSGGTAAAGNPIYALAAAITRLEIDDDVLTGGGATTYAGSYVVSCSYATQPTTARIRMTPVGTFAYFYIAYDAAGSPISLSITDCDFTQFTAADSLLLISGGSTTPTTLRVQRNIGYNPVGSSVPGAAFSLAGSTSAWTNNTGVDGTLYVTAAGTVTAVHVNGVAVSSTLAVGDTYRVAAGGTFTLTYSGAPTLVFVGD